MPAPGWFVRRRARARAWRAVCTLAALAVCALAGEAAAAPGDNAFELGTLVGHTLVDDENALGNAPMPGARIASGAIAGVRGGYAFSPAVSGELEATFSQPGFAAIGARARVIAYRAHALVHLRPGPIRPFAVAGIGGSYLSTRSQLASTDADPELYWGIGARLEATPRLDLRLDLRHRIVPGRTSTTSDLLEVSLGASWRL